MRLNSIYIVFSVIVLLTCNQAFAIQVTDKEVADLSARINSVEKVDQLYSIRYAVGKYASRTDLTLRQQQLLLNSMKMLSDEFKERNHFRNAADVYKDYLDYNNNYLISYNVFAKDSLLAVHKKIEESELDAISALDTEIAGLTNTRAAVSGLKKKYYSFGGFGAVGIIVLTVVISLSRNRAIQNAQTQINANRENLRSLNSSTINAGMTEGTITFCKEKALANIEILNSIIDSVNLQEEKNLLQKEVIALKHAVSKLNNLTS
jgi:hypothetical protein